MPHEEFISEPLTPVVGTSDTEMMGRGEPGLPWRFVWRGLEYRVLGIIRKWKTSSREVGGVEMYLRRHWYEILVEPQSPVETQSPVEAQSPGTVVPGSPPTNPIQMTIYCDRQAQDLKHPKRRWFVFSMHKDQA